MASMRAFRASGSTVASARGEPHLRGAADRRQRPAGGDHRLGRDAVPEVGGPADHVLLDDRDLGAEAGRVGGRGVAGRAPADDHEAQRHGARLPIRLEPRRHGRAAAAATVGRVVPRSVLSRATDAVANRLDRRSFIARSALVGSALVTAPDRPPAAAHLGLRRGVQLPGPELRLRIAVLRRLHRVLLRDLRRQRLPGRVADRRVVEGRRLVASAAGRPATTWTATSPAGLRLRRRRHLQRRRATAPPCGCGNGRCDHRKAGLHRVPLRQLQQPAPPASARSSAGSSPAPQPWLLEPTCSAQRRPHRQQHPSATTGRASRGGSPITPVAGDWNGDGKCGHRLLRQPQRPLDAAPDRHDRGPSPVFTYGLTGRRPAGRRRLERRRHRQHRASSARATWHFSNTRLPGRPPPT